MADAERPTFGSDVIQIRDYFEELRRTDIQHWREILSQLELRLQQRFDAQENSVSTAMIAAEKAVNAALISSEKAVDKAEQAQATRNIVANEFRATLSDQNQLMWRREAGQAAIDALEDKMTFRLTSIEGRLGNVEVVLPSEFVRVTEYRTNHASTESRIVELERALSMSMGREASQRTIWGVAVVLLSLAISVGVHFIR